LDPKQRSVRLAKKENEIRGKNRLKEQKEKQQKQKKTKKRGGEG